MPKTFNLIDLAFSFSDIRGDANDALDEILKHDGSTTPVFVLYHEDHCTGSIDLELAAAFPGAGGVKFLNLGKIDFLGQTFVPKGGDVVVGLEATVLIHVLTHVDALGDALSRKAFELLDEEDVVNIFADLVHNAIRRSFNA